MCADAGFHADQARRYIGEPRFHLATRPFLPQHDRAACIVAHDVERVLADIDADHGDRGIGCLRHSVLLVFGAPRQLRLLAGQEHGRTIPLGDISYRPRNDSSILSRMPRSCWNIRWSVELRRPLLNLALLEALECGSLVRRWKQRIGGTATWTHRGGTCFSRPCSRHCLRW